MMSHKRFLKLLLVVLSLALWAGTANAASAASNFAASQSSVSLTYVKGGPAAQTAVDSVAVNIGLSPAGVTAADPGGDSFGVSATGWPSWLTAVTGGGPVTTNPSGTGAVGITVSFNESWVPPANTSYPATFTYTILFTQSGHANFSLPVTLNYLISPLALSNAPAQFSAVGSSFSPNNGVQATIWMSVVDSADYTSTTFAVDAATEPAWLHVATPGPNEGVTTGTQSTSGFVVFTLDPGVTPALSPGIYTASVGFTSATTTPSAYPWGEYYVTVTLSVSNPPPSLLVKEGVDGTTYNKTWSAGASIPIPTVTPYSSNEPIPFSATCTITLTSGTSPNTCTVTPASGAAYSWGTVVDVPGLLASYFNNVPLGNTVTVAIKIVPTNVASSSAPSTTITYIYTLVPIPATVTSLSPSAVAPLSSQYSTVVLVQGTGFASPSMVANGSGLGETMVWLGTTPAATYTVLSSTLMAVTVPSNALTAIPSGSTSATLAIGVANYGGGGAPSAPTSSSNLTITTSPVVYGLTNGATFKQPTPGNSPNVAAYELISIFGANFMPSATNVSGTLDAYNKFPTTLPISGNGPTAVTLTVTFTVGSGKSATTYLAPIIYANATQINAIVPSGMAVGATPAVTIATGGSTTVPLTVNVVTADPGIYTFGGDGTGQGAIENVVSSQGVVTTTMNGLGTNGATAAVQGETISIYVTGLGAPDSTGADAVTNKSTLFPSACVAINSTTKGIPGYLQVVNTSATGYTSPKWTTIDGAVISYGPNTLLGGLPPCMASPVSVVITNPATNATLTLSGNSIGYAGFVSGAVAGLYQINATLPALLTGAFSDGSALVAGTAYPIQVTIGAASSPATATIQF